MCACPPDPCPAIVPWHQINLPRERDQTISSKATWPLLCPRFVSLVPLFSLLYLPQDSQLSFLFLLCCFTLQSETQSPRIPSFHATHKHKPSGLFVCVLAIMKTQTEEDKNIQGEDTKVYYCSWFHSVGKHTPYNLWLCQPCLNSWRLYIANLRKSEACTLCSPAECHLLWLSLA